MPASSHRTQILLSWRRLQPTTAAERRLTSTGLEEWHVVSVRQVHAGTSPKTACVTNHRKFPSKPTTPISMASRDQPSSSKTRRQRRERRDAFPATVPKLHKRAIGRSTTRETPLHVRGLGVTLDDSTRAYFRSRVGFKLGKYALALTRISVRINDVAGPKGAPRYECRFTVALPNVPQAVVTASDQSARSAFDHAVDAAARVVHRLLRRGQQSRRRLEAAT
jgi:ribosome-associated translation inhibitor RaiA